MWIPKEVSHLKIWVCRILGVRQVSVNKEIIGGGTSGKKISLPKIKMVSSSWGHSSFKELCMYKFVGVHMSVHV